MKIWKLVSGILSIVFCAITGFQSCAAGMYNTMSANGQDSGSAGVMVAILMLTGGIVSIALRNSNGRGKDIALIILYALAALIGFTSAGDFSDLNIWSFWCVICAIMAIVSMGKEKKA
jgi:hypothetical protein